MAVHSPPTLLLTRPEAASVRFAQGLQGFEVVIAPLMEIVATGAEVDLAGMSGIILTSENAAQFLPKAHLPAYCVGPRTAQAATTAGFEARISGPDANGLVAALQADPPDGPLLHIHGRHTRGDIAKRLQAGGILVHTVAAYDQRAVPPAPQFYDALRRQNLIVPLFSPRSAGLFAEAAGQPSENMALLALSPAIKAALPEAFQDKVRVIPRPDGSEMRKALEPLGQRRISP